MKKEYNTDEGSLERIYKRKYFKTIYINDITPDEVIARMEEIKKLAESEKYERVVVYADVEETDDRGPFSYIRASGMILESDEEYRERLKRMVLILERNKQLWKDKSDFYNGTGEGCWADKVKKYKDIIDKI